VQANVSIGRQAALGIQCTGSAYVRPYALKDPGLRTSNNSKDKRKQAKQIRQDNKGPGQLEGRITAAGRLTWALFSTEVGRPDSALCGYSVSVGTQ
jgi:hypothetical protein